MLTCSVRTADPTKLPHIESKRRTDGSLASSDPQFCTTVLFRQTYPSKLQFPFVLFVCFVVILFLSGINHEIRETHESKCRGGSAVRTFPSHVDVSVPHSAR